MKAVKIGIAVAVTLVILVVVLLNREQEDTPATEIQTPEKCVTAFYEATVDQDKDRLQTFLSPALQNQTHQLIQEKANIQSLMNHGSMKNKDSVFVDMDEIRKEGTRRVRFQLEQAKGSWIITAIGSPKEIKLNVPFGTHVGKVPNP